jgi:hypothetical protein
MRESGTEGEVYSAMTRRRMIGTVSALAGLSTVFGTQAVAAQEMKEVPAKSANTKRTSLHQEVDLPTAPDRIYHLLLDSKQFAELSGMPAEIEAMAGGSFAMFGKVIYGRNVELIPNERLIQAWGDTEACQNFAQ